MRDLIDRQEAIDALDCINGVEEVLRSLPPAQPHTYRGVTLNDVMMYFDSLEGNEDAWTEFCSCLECRGWGLYHIRSATDKNVGTTDTISRQAAIDAFEDTTFTKNEIRRRLSEVPPAQPEPCEDAVSRKAVKDGFVEMCSLICPYTEKQRHTMCGSCLLGTAFDVLEATQPVTPKQRTGHWIPVGIAEVVGGESAQWGSAVAYHKCSECDGQALRDDFEQEVLSRWCPNCGLKMMPSNAK